MLAAGPFLYHFFQIGSSHPVPKGRVLKAGVKKTLFWDDDWSIALDQSPNERSTFRAFLMLDSDILVQLQFPVQLPCFNFTTITNPYLGVQWLRQSLGEWRNSWKIFNLWLNLFLRRVGRDVHSTDSDSPWRSSPRLLPNPDSRRRVAAFDPYWRDLLRFCYDFHHCFPL